MAVDKYERPWQVMPAKIIKLALEHAEKNNDFDHQVAYLLLDIGVETALKVFLENKGQNIENLKFPELIKRVRDELSKNNSSLIKEIEESIYFHNIRNKLYHRGDGVKPTEDNLKLYSKLAKKVVEEVLELKLQTEERKFAISVAGKEREFEELAALIEYRLKHFQENCAIVTEKTRPVYASREFAMQMQYISWNWLDHEGLEPEERIEIRNLRLEKFNELVEKKQTDYDFVNYVLQNVNHLYVRVALQHIDEEWQELWNEYVELDKRRSRLAYDWKTNVHSGRWNSGQVREEFEKIIAWIETQETKVVKWINSHLKYVEATAYHPLVIP
jgi:hypothetical protein